MGRPINKKHIGDGALVKIQVTAVKFAAGGEITDGRVAYYFTALN